MKKNPIFNVRNKEFLLKLRDLLSEYNAKICVCDPGFEYEGHLEILDADTWAEMATFNDSNYESDELNVAMIDEELKRY